MSNTKHGYTLNLRGGYQYEVTADYPEYIAHLKQFVASHDDLLAALEEARVALTAEFQRTAARYLVGPLHTVELAIAKAIKE